MGVQGLPGYQKAAKEERPCLLGWRQKGQEIEWKEETGREVAEKTEQQGVARAQGKGWVGGAGG